MNVFLNVFNVVVYHEVLVTVHGATHAQLLLVTLKMPRSFK
jgi:hypothetical protein